MLRDGWRGHGLPGAQPGAGMERRNLGALRQGTGVEMGAEEPGAGKGTKSRSAAGESDPRVGVLLSVVSHTKLDSGAPGREKGSCPSDLGYLFIWGGGGRAGHAGPGRGWATISARLL